MRAYFPYGLSQALVPTGTPFLCMFLCRSLVSVTFHFSLDPLCGPLRLAVVVSLSLSAVSVCVSLCCCRSFFSLSISALNALDRCPAFSFSVRLSLCLSVTDMLSVLHYTSSSSSNTTSSELFSATPVQHVSAVPRRGADRRSSLRGQSEPGTAEIRLE